MTRPLDRKTRFEALVAEHGDVIAATASRYLGDRAEAEDVTQEVLFDVWRALDGLDPARDPRPWLRTFAVRRAVDRLRARAARIATAGDGGLDAGERAAPAPSLDFEDELRALPAGERAATLLYYREGYAVAEAAEALGVPVGTVKTWLFRARARLRARYVADDAAATRRTSPKGEA